jgi:hypothetical protein
MLSYAFSERVMRTGVEKEWKMDRGLGLGQCLRMPSLVVALRVPLLTPLDQRAFFTQHRDREHGEPWSQPWAVVLWGGFSVLDQGGS